MKQNVSRRRFMYGVASVAGAMFTGPYLMRAAEPGKDKLRLAFIGTGGQAGSHVGLAGKETCPCYADVDQSRWDNKDANRSMLKLAPNAKGYTDYRQMYDKHEKEIDAVVVTTPDHSHAAASMRALRAGKHCYTEKPLTWSVSEARLLAETAAANKLATQMGNMGHANEGNRLVVEWVRAGLLGDVTEVHTWTNRPVWPQGIERPAAIAVPAGLDWENWIGPAPYREYHDSLHPFKWRGWFDFGCGAIGDMGCHTWDCVFWSMAPDYPTKVELLEIAGRTKETYPKQSHIKWTFPAKGTRPAFVAHWYEGGMKPAVPEEMANDPYWQPKPKKPASTAATTASAAPAAPPVPGKVELPGSGSLFIGTKGKMLVSGDYGDSPRLIPETFMQGVTRPDKSIPRSPGHKPEWILACKGEKPWDSPGSHFSTYAGPLTEVMLLGAMAIKMGEVGSKIECDAEKRVILTKEAVAMASREYRKGWEL